MNKKVLYSAEETFSLIRNNVLEGFILGFGLEMPDSRSGRSVNLTQLWLAAREKCGDCSMDEVLDALYTLRPDHVNLYKFVPPAEWHNLLMVGFDHWRDTSEWREFFNGDFRIKVLPNGRLRFQKLGEQLQNELSRLEPLQSKPRPLIGFHT
jgi:hypothetical protein